MVDGVEWAPVPSAPRLMLSAGGADNPEILHDNGTVAVSVMDCVALCANAAPLEAMTAISNESVVLIVCLGRAQSIILKNSPRHTVT